MSKLCNRLSAISRGVQLVHPQLKANQHYRQYGTRVPCVTALNMEVESIGFGSIDDTMIVIVMTTAWIKLLLRDMPTMTWTHMSTVIVTHMSTMIMTHMSTMIMTHTC